MNSVAGTSSQHFTNQNSRRRVAITGFYAAWRVGTGWREIRSSPWARVPDCLRLCCEAARSDSRRSEARNSEVRHERQWKAEAEADASEESAPERAVLPPKNYRSQPDVLRSRVRDELAGSGLWDKSSRKLLMDGSALGTVFSSSKGFWPQRLEPQFFDVVDWLCCDGAARDIARSLGAHGPILSPVAACATGAHSIALGAGWIEDGRCDVVIAGAVERPIEPLVQAGYEQLGAMSGSGVMRPFDARRDGFVPNAGMGFLVLEDAERASGRAAAIHAYLAGHAMGADATAALQMDDSGASVVRAVQCAQNRAAQFEVQRGIDYINVHGTATRHNDLVEARAMRQMFGTDVSASTCSASSTKPLTGHLLGAAGAVEAALCVQALSEGFVPPTLNLETLDTECEFDWTPQIGRNRQIESALSLSYGFGGHIGALLFHKANAATSSASTCR